MRTRTEHVAEAFSDNASWEKSNKRLTERLSALTARVVFSKKECELTRTKHNDPLKFMRV